MRKLDRQYKGARHLPQCDHRRRSEGGQGCAEGQRDEQRGRTLRRYRHACPPLTLRLGFDIVSLNSS